MRRVAILSVGLLSALSGAAAASTPQSSADKPAQSHSSARPCSPPTHGSDATRISEAAPACLEILAGFLEVRQFLETMAREQKWHVGQDQTSEDSWSFVRYLDAEELQCLAKADILGGRIVWAEGKAAVQVRTSDAGEGFTRVQISAKFQGKGQSKDRFARPTDLWPLASRGILEGDMIDALESRFKPPR